MNADGSDIHRLTDDEADDLDPHWSPDGTQIIFSSNRDGNMGIYVMNADGSNQRRLTENDYDDLNPDWSPDGTRIAFYREENGQTDIYIMNSDGSDQHKITTNTDGAIVPVWRPSFTPVGENRDLAVSDRSTRPNDGMVMVYVPGGTFQMGSSEANINSALEMCKRNSGSGDCHRAWFENEGPQHTVTLDAYWIDRTEVTSAQYSQCVEHGYCDAVDCGSELNPKYPDQPVACVSWNDAQTYCDWAGVRLPTEAEWEYAARGPDGNTFPWGNSFDPARLNYCDSNCTYEWRDATYDDGFKMTAPVGSFESGASWCGALDMAGNAWEWVADWYEADYYTKSPTHNPQGPEAGTHRVMRGGSCYYIPSYLRSARRASIPPLPGETNNSGAFRCAASVTTVMPTTSQIPPTDTPVHTATPSASTTDLLAGETLPLRSPFEFFSEQVRDSFKIYVSLPKEYDPEHSHDYPVIYLLDGDWYFDDSSRMIDDGGVAGIAASLSDGGRIPESIVVGIGYVDFSARARDFHWRPEKFHAFLVDELIPYIDEEYNTDENSARTLIGHSSGGYFTLYAFFQYDENGHNPFQQFVAISGDFNRMDWALFNEESRMNRRIGEEVPINGTLYLAVGGQEETRFVTSNKDMAQKLESRHYDGLRFKSRKYGSEDHMSIVTPAVWAGLLWVFGE